MAYVNAQKNGYSVDAVVDKAKAKDLINKTVEEDKDKVRKLLAKVADATKSDQPDGSGKPMSLVMQILRPLRERLNTAVDLFRYNGHTNFERFLSKDELSSEIKKMISEKEFLSEKINATLGKKIKVEHIKFEKLPKVIRTDIEYARQLDNDIKCGKRLIEITC